ncbi:hypothetical protein E8E15_007974 [Penicillium rubens]|uniref:Uncharacterized protein n=1 Tax=Penicillium chrysogenum TaxID=5076 RepID=A0A167TM34_PENCH|nr:uncharacterized protein N7525_007138 [Penicillium rubens]XP_056570980.1 uncharacterized protein N7489_000923 [Penicillium chrysogenum]KAF3028095.1 hypothetical protein E8E15_007974 [Penicillium rubens]KAJ5049468.1 hypothetical protein NUH16_007987 [Penicillium rubens]KAJ5250513.1 hypothetical protein N7489_000923 [Penicillium chrysogenum]KAJ5266123.1 hypothetical protein N7524_007141 [Penicillium chrysogenum]KAJ5269413.1 hypothetical protein N7505_005171 [Penicillium chrysogenum]
MTTQIKLDEKLAELTMDDARLLILGTLCHNGKIDSEKLGALAGVKKTSARANYWRAKKILFALMEKEESATQATESKPEDSNAAPKARGSAKGRATKDADSPAKHHKTSAMAAPEPEFGSMYNQEEEEVLLFTIDAN